MDDALRQAIVLHATQLSMVAIERRWMEVQKILEGIRPGAVSGGHARPRRLAPCFRTPQGAQPFLFKALDDERLVALNLHQRLALMMVEHPTKEAVNQLKALRTSNQLQRLTASFHERIGHLPRR